MSRSVGACLFGALSPVFVSTAVGQCATAWIATPGAVQDVYAMTEWDPDGPGPQPSRIAIGGAFTFAGGVVANRVVVWDPATDAYSSLGSGLDHVVFTLVGLPDGSLVAGGSFTFSGATPVTSVARWDGAAWQPLGTGISPSGIGPAVSHLAVLPNGDLVAGGGFTAAGGVPADNIARWDGAVWSPLGSGIPYPGLRSLLVRRNGDLLAGHNGGVWRWTGSTWTNFGTGGAGAPDVLHELANGDVLAGGFGDVRRCSGGIWTTMGPGFAGGFPFGASMLAFAELPDGDVVAGGSFLQWNGQPRNHIARWDGAAWQAFGTGANDRVFALHFHGPGQLLVGGAFTSVDGITSNRLARIGTTCPAAVVDLGGGCPGSGGGNVLTAPSWPYVDGTLHTRGTELSDHAIVVADTGLTPIVPGFPLDSVFAEAPAGCELHLVPLIQQVHASTTGTVDNALFLPNTPPLVGVTFYQQMFAFEVDVGLQFTEITATNVLQLTAGSF